VSSTVIPSSQTAVGSTMAPHHAANLKSLRNEKKNPGSSSKGCEKNKQEKLSPSALPSGFSPVQLSALLTVDGSSVYGVDLIALPDLLPQASQHAPVSAVSEHAESARCCEPAGFTPEEVSPSQQITMLLEQEGIKAMPEASPFDFSGAMPPPALPTDESRAAACGSCEGKRSGRAEDRRRGEDGEKRLSEGTILELFEQLDSEQQRIAGEAAMDSGLALAADEIDSSVCNPAFNKQSRLMASTPAQQLTAVDVRLAEQSYNSKISGDGTSPFNQLSPLHLSDFL